MSSPPALPTIDDVRAHHSKWDAYGDGVCDLCLRVMYQSRAPALDLPKRPPAGETTLQRIDRAHNVEQWSRVFRTAALIEAANDCSGCRKQLRHGDLVECPLYLLSGADNVICPKCYTRLCNNKPVNFITEMFVLEFGDEPSP